MSEFNFKDIFQKVSGYVKSRSQQVLTVVVVVVVAVLGYYYYSSVFLVENGKKYSAQFERLQREALSTQLGGDEEKFISSKAKLVTFAKDHFSYTAGKRATYWLAEFDRSRSEYTNAATRYMDIFKSAKNHYLAPVSLYKAAFCYSEIGEFDDAIELLEKFAIYYESSYLYPQTQIFLAQIHATLGDFVLARKGLDALIIKLNADQQKSPYLKEANNQLFQLNIAEKQAGRKMSVTPGVPQFKIPPMK